MGKKIWAGLVGGLVAVGLAGLPALASSYPDPLVLQYGSSFARSLLARFQAVQDPRDFGNSGTCTGQVGEDDTAALQAAANAAGTHPWLSFLPLGGTVRIDATEKCRITSNVTLPVGVKLQGNWHAPGIPGQTGGSGVTGAPFLQRGSSISEAAGAEILLSGMSGIDGMLIQRDGITYTETNANAFSGIGVGLAPATTWWEDPYIINSGIMGFGLGIDFSAGVDRARITNDAMDNQAGIKLWNSADSNIIRDVHMWPYVTFYNGQPFSSGGLNRTGIGVDLENYDPDTHIDNLFTFSYLSGGIYIKNAGASIMIDHVYCDGIGAFCVKADSGTNEIFVTNSGSFNQTDGFIADPGSGDIHFTNDYANYSSHSSLWARSGQVYVNGFYSNLLPGGTGPDYTHANGIVLGDGVVGSNAYLNDVHFVGNLTGYPDIQGGSTPGTLQLGEFTTDRSPSDQAVQGTPSNAPTIACANTLAIPATGTVFLVSGTCTINSATNFYSGRAVTLIFLGTPTITTGGVFLLSGNTNWTPSSTDAALSLIGDGPHFVEVGRKN